MINEATETQAEKIGKALIALKPNVSKEDRRDYRQHANCSEQLIVLYLKGEVKSLSIGLDMLEFFTKKIAEREQKLNQIINA